MADTYTGKGKVNFPVWNNQKWTEPEVGQSKMEEFWRWLHNSYMSGEKALHSEALSNKQQAMTLKASGPIMLQQEALDITRTLLMKWIAQK